MMRIFKLSITFALFISFAAACGGDVHLTNGQKIAEFAPQQAGPKIIQESQILGTPSGIQVVALIFPPSHFLIDRVREEIHHSVDYMLHPLMALGNSVNDFYFLGLREVLNSPIEHFSASGLSSARSQWPLLVEGAIKSKISTMSTFLAYGEREVTSPFETFEGVSKYVHDLLATRTEPIWLHLLYFRDNDILKSSNYDDTYFKDSVQNFQRQLKISPLSPFRTFIHLVSFNTSGPNRPFRIPSRDLQSYIDPLPHRYYELDRLLLPMDPTGADKGLIDAFMDELGKEMIAISRKTVLQQIPKEETLRVKINGIQIPRHGYQYDKNTNKIEFFAPTAMKYKISTGDSIEIEYETAEPKN